MEAKNKLSKWVDEFLVKYSSAVAHCFIFHFNIADYVDNTNSLKLYLSKLFADRQMVIFYNRSEGISFALPGHKDKFMEAAGLSEDSSDPLTQAITGDILPKSPGSAFPLLEKVLRQGSLEEKKAILIIDYAETLFPPASYSMMLPEDRNSITTIRRWAMDNQIASTGNLVILITNNLTDVHESVRAPSSKIESIMIPYPQLEERTSYINYLLQKHSNLKLVDLTIQQLANATAGLSKILIEDIALRAIKSSYITKELVLDRKESIIKSEFNDVLQILDPSYGFEAIGGLEHIKEYFIKNIINPLQAGNIKRCPMGILMTGAAGTGKSAIAIATAKEAKVNFVELNLAKILGMYVGSSERNLEKALSAIVTLTPTIVFIDEIDQSVSRGNAGDSGVSNRIFKRLLEFMSDTTHRGRVVFLAASNRPDLIDPALRRAGRFDKKIAFFVPTAEERESIFKAIFTKYSIDYEIESFSKAVSMTEGYTGADIEAIVIKSVEIAMDNGQDKILEDDLIKACSLMLPSVAGIEFMTELALKECNDKSLVPKLYWPWLEKIQKERSGVDELRQCCRGEKSVGFKA